MKLIKIVTQTCMTEVLNILSFKSRLMTYYCLCQWKYDIIHVFLGANFKKQFKSRHEGVQDPDTGLGNMRPASFICIILDSYFNLENVLNFKIFLFFIKITLKSFYFDYFSTFLPKIKCNGLRFPKSSLI